MWSQLAGYASRISPPRLQGRAIVLAMSGIPAALSLGVPAGTLLGAAALAMGLAGTVPAVFFASTAAWGLAFGGTPALVQTASARVSGSSADVARSFVATTWNAAIARAGVLGEWLLDRAGTASLRWAALLLLAISITFVLGARRLREAAFR